MYDELLVEEATSLIATPSSVMEGTKTEQVSSFVERSPEVKSTSTSFRIGQTKDLNSAGSFPSIVLDVGNDETVSAGTFKDIIDRLALPDPSALSS